MKKNEFHKIIRFRECSKNNLEIRENLSVW